MGTQHLLGISGRIASRMNRNRDGAETYGMTAAQAGAAADRWNEEREEGDTEYVDPVSQMAYALAAQAAGRPMEGTRCAVAGRAGVVTEVFNGDSVAVLFDDDPTTVMIVQLDDPTLDIEDAA